MKHIAAMLFFVFITSHLFSQEVLVGYYSRKRFVAGAETAVPVGRLKDITESGYGGSAGFLYTFGRFEPGILAGFYYFDGKSEMTDNLKVIPLVASAGYRIKLGYRFSLEPQIAAGPALIILKQDPDSSSFDRVYDQPRYQTKKSVEPLTWARIGIGYRLYDNVRISAVPEYASIYEKSGVIQFLTLGVHLTYLF